jgi:hypothetical protein
VPQDSGVAFWAGTIPEKIDRTIFDTWASGHALYRTKPQDFANPSQPEQGPADTFVVCCHVCDFAVWVGSRAGTVLIML